MPNARLGIALTELNRARIYRKLAAGPDFAANEKKMLALLLECRPTDRPGRADMRAVFDQLKGEKRVLFAASHNPTYKDKAQFEKLLQRLSPSDHWVAVSQEDPRHGELLQLAKKHHFDTVLLSTRKAAQEDSILGSPDFTMFFDSPEEISAAQRELTTKGTRYEWEENDAEHSFVGVGDFALRHTPGPFEFSQQGFQPCGGGAFLAGLRGDLGGPLSAGLDQGGDDRLLAVEVAVDGAGA